MTEFASALAKQFTENSSKASKGTTETEQLEDVADTKIEWSLMFSSIAKNDRNEEVTIL